MWLKAVKDMNSILVAKQCTSAIQKDVSRHVTQSWQRQRVSKHKRGSSHKRRRFATGVRGQLQLLMQSHEECGSLSGVRALTTQSHTMNWSLDWRWWSRHAWTCVGSEHSHTWPPQQRGMADNRHNCESGEGSGLRHMMRRTHTNTHEDNNTHKHARGDADDLLSHWCSIV